MLNFSFAIRLANLNDLEIVAQIAESTFRIAFEADNDPTDFEKYVQKAFNIDTIKAEIVDPLNQYFLLEIAGRIQGYLKLREGNKPDCLKGNHLIELERIYISPEVQNQGLGKELFDFALNLAKQSGFNMLWLGVWEENKRAIKFYQRMGMRQFGSHIFELGKDKQTDWIMAMNI